MLCLLCNSSNLPGPAHYNKIMITFRGSPPPRTSLALCLLIPLALLAASCGSDSDTSPPSIPSDNDAIAVAAGSSHTCALQQTGEIACWGSNERGQLGDGTNDDSEVPVPVMGIDDATAIAAGGELAGGGHSCALHEDGTISCWGTNRQGQLGNGQSGRNIRSSVPVQVVGITDAKAITTGISHSCALHEDGTISCWGDNDWGQLGNGTNRRSLVPVRVTGFGG